MVIQRIQTLFLLLASVLMLLVSFVAPITQVSSPEPESLMTLYIYDMPALLVINLIVGVLLMVNIFMFKNLPMQMKVTRICIVLTIASAAFLAYVLYSIEGEVMYATSSIMLILSLICEILALKGMNKDYKLLRSYDRLR